MSLAPTISVIMPAYNSAAFIARSIHSAQQQTVRPLEILVVDDGSKDNTAEVAAECGDLVRVIRQANGGPAAARNHGAREARGEWLAFLDSDDTWLPVKLERQVAAMEDSITLLHAYCVQDKCCKLAPRETDFTMLWDANRIATSSVLIRKSAFDAIGGFDEDRSIMAVEDYNLWLRLAHRGARMRVIPEELLDYTPGPNNLSGQFSRMLRSELNNVEKIRVDCGLSDQQVQGKLATIYSEWGEALFHIRFRVSSGRWSREIPGTGSAGCRGDCFKIRSRIRCTGFSICCLTRIHGSRPAGTGGSMTFPRSCGFNCVARMSPVH